MPGMTVAKGRSAGQLVLFRGMDCGRLSRVKDWIAWQVLNSDGGFGDRLKMFGNVVRISEANGLKESFFGKREDFCD